MSTVALVLAALAFVVSVLALAVVRLLVTEVRQAIGASLEVLQNTPGKAPERPVEPRPAPDAAHDPYARLRPSNAPLPPPPGYRPDDLRRKAP